MLRPLPPHSAPSACSWRRWMTWETGLRESEAVSPHREAAPLLRNTPGVPAASWMSRAHRVRVACQQTVPTIRRGLNKAQFDSGLLGCLWTPATHRHPEQAQLVGWGWSVGRRGAGEGSV